MANISREILMGHHIASFGYFRRQCVRVLQSFNFDLIFHLELKLFNGVQFWRVWKKIAAAVSKFSTFLSRVFAHYP
jgi:hypothetical protein